MDRPPLLLQPDADVKSQPSGFPAPKLVTPTPERQYERLQSKIDAIEKAWNINSTPDDLDPSKALVFEICGSLEDFQKAVEKIEGLELVFDAKPDQKYDPDDYFFLQEEDKETKSTVKSDKKVDGKIFCLLSNRVAQNYLLTLWKKYCARGFPKRSEYGKFKKLFQQLKDVRLWNAKDRFEDTGILKIWREDYSKDVQPTPFEIELFYRKDKVKREKSFHKVSAEIERLGGSVLESHTIEEIAYCGMLVELPRKEIECLVNNFEEVELAHIDDIMFFHPGAQTCLSTYYDQFEDFCTTDKETETTSHDEFQIPSIEQPIAAMLDGYPLANHVLLKGRVELFDKDNLEEEYSQVSYRRHGTAMASLIVNGDLNKKGEEKIRYPLFVRPILKPELDLDHEYFREKYPEDKLFIKLLQRAIQDVVDNAPTVKIINLSIGDGSRPFISIMSPAARLLDYFAYKFKLLFVVSAGNNSGVDSYIGDYKSFYETDIKERNKKVCDVLKKNQRNLKLLAPSESINSLTVGALYDDNTDVDEDKYNFWCVERGLPSPISALGLGINNSIKPEIFFNGGRKFLKRHMTSNAVVWADYPKKEPGIKVVAPGIDLNPYFYTWGTSDAAAQVTHEGIKCFQVLQEIFEQNKREEDLNDYGALLIKAMLVHGASYPENVTTFFKDVGVKECERCRWIGYGVPNVSQTFAGTEERITLIGYGELESNKAVKFDIPFPFESLQRYKRRLWTTLAYFSPINPTSQKYRGVKLTFKTDDDLKQKNKVFPNSILKTGKTNENGVIQHSILEGSAVANWFKNDFKIGVERANDSVRESVPFVIFVTLEFAEKDLGDVYVKIAEKVKEKTSARVSIN